MNSETKERVILVVCGVVAAAVAIMLAIRATWQFASLALFVIPPAL